MILNFKVPKNIYNKIDSYDLVKPKEERVAAKAKKVNTFPKAGLPEQLIPESVIPKTVLMEAINLLNLQHNDTYWYDSGSFAGSHGNIQYLITKKANKYWSAIWFDTQNSDIVFGFAHSFRNLKSYKNYRYNSFLNETKLDETKFTSIKHNKKDYLYYSQLVTPSDLIDRKFNCVIPAYNQRNETVAFTNLFKARLGKYTLVWSKSNNVFEAYNTPLYDLLGVRGIKDHNWVPDFNYILSKVPDVFSKKINIPYFRRKLTAMCDDAVKQYQSSDFDRYKLKFSTRSIEILQWIDQIYDWTVPVDYLQQVWEGLKFDENVSQFRYVNTSNHNVGTEWLRQNVPIKSFINMFVRDYSVFIDTISMLRDILGRNPDLKYNGRWRVQELHDWAMAEQWKQSNKNQNLPQDLFPAPVKVDNMTFIQPINTHQLAQWGRAARNCVGSSAYYNGIIKHNHFIILALSKNEPYLTIQARLEGEELKVTQIKKTCNASLSYTEEDEYRKVFQKALIIRSAQLAEEPQEVEPVVES
ncbi:hypothetical protein b23_0036 [Synechococcus phage B23]|nr:hypothetical protein b23_0036 [Synechococcus phage B23]